ncbi:hypothetical protein BofuT4_uP062650.1 [Botrytis cinerea T4]|uniref:Uncharacterized protein n=1 Tax=Botryotinia fuckeliana (strain T4) TaxID=999810 RepID=G2XTJ9_BOTF4|nr:hypothetical protein BofuT4_uP062650.1 [Botrytis cinerea T4]
MSLFLSTNPDYNQYTKVMGVILHPIVGFAPPVFAIFLKFAQQACDLVTLRV